jgi:hypothetical protein
MVRWIIKGERNSFTAKDAKGKRKRRPHRVHCFPTLWHCLPSAITNQ